MEMKVRVQADPKRGELSVRFLDLPLNVSTFSVKIAEGIYLEVDEAGRVAGMEVTDMERVFGLRLDEVTLYGPLVGVKEAAALIGVNRPNFIRDHASRDDFPHPVADLASGRIWLLADIVEYVRKKGLRNQEILGHMLMVYMEANEITVGALAQELGLDQRRTLRLLLDRSRLGEVDAESLAKRYGMEMARAQGLLARLRALRAISELARE